MAKRTKELFASNLNGIPASVRCVSSMIVILNAEFARLLAAHANKNDDEGRRSPTKVLCFASKSYRIIIDNFMFKTHCRLTFIAVLT